MYSYINLIYLFPHCIWGNVALGVVFPLHLVNTKTVERRESFSGAQLDRNFRSATLRGFSTFTASSHLCRQEGRRQLEVIVKRNNVSI